MTDDPRMQHPAQSQYAPQTYAPPVSARKPWIARHKVLTALGVLVALVIIGSAAGGGDDDVAAGPAAGVVLDAEAGGAAEAAAEAEPAAAPADAPPPGGVGLGGVAADGKFEFTVTQVEPGGTHVGTESFGADAQGQYVLVHLTVKNIGTEAQYFDGSSQTLVDDQGREFSADSTAGIYLDESNSFLNQINPGNQVEGIVVFDVPADAVLVSITLHDSMFSGGVSVRLT